ncbi:MAG: ubiquitin-conjugating enzyme E2 [Planctomycetaceae bacterium]|nr:ubiquitin-conjugating enzyme E2 [Planctomycetaceae bacterium]
MQILRVNGNFNSAGILSVPPKPQDKIVIKFDDIPTPPASKLSIPVLVPPPISVPPPLPRVRSQLITPVLFDYPKPPAGKLPPRQRRLYSDVKAVAERLVNSPYIEIKKVEGDPPDYYLLEYHIRGLEAVRGNEITYRNHHTVEIRLTADYPRQQPMCKLLTPIFHPNFEPSHICIGDHWTAQERLIDLIIRIGEMIAYQSYNVKSPLDGEAAMWADQHGNILPTDASDLMPPE